MRDDRPSIGLLGYGAFGRLVAEHLAPHTAVHVHDPSYGGSAPLEEAAAQDWVVLAVPVQAMEGALQAIAPHVRAGAVVCDVGSVKTLPVQWMAQILPPSVGVLGTHPMFGPETARERGTIANEPIVLCRERMDDEPYARVRALLSETLGLRVIELTADEHDREAALVQGVTHLIGRAATEMGLPELDTGTLAYRRLLQLKHNTERDSADLYDAIQRLNPHAAEARRNFMEALIAVVNSTGP